LLAGLVRAGEVRLDDDSFVKDGAAVHFQRVRRIGSRDTVGHGGFTIAADVRKAKRTKRASKTAPGKAAKAGDERRKGWTGDAKRARAAAGLASNAKALFEALREWRLAEAKRAGIPAFRILNDRTLLGVATESPGDEDALLRVGGIGPGLARRYGAALLGIVARHAPR
jgi:DNA topoisomerase-3